MSPWDENKAAQKFAKHGVSFEVARAVFRDPFAIEYVDDRDDFNEERFIIMGLVEGRVVFVAYTMREESIRIISARLAEPFEKREYHEQNT